MRIISGSAKGRKLKTVPGEGTRPVTDRVKESLFDILAGDIAGCRFLDLFAGTGGVGLEALSRGAAEAVFVEQGRAAFDTLRFNLAHTQLQDRAQTVRADVFAFLSVPPPTPFDFIYIAPPQYKGLWLETLHALDARPGWLSAEGAIIVQIHPREFQAVELQHFEPAGERKYGSTLLCFYELREPG
ncbi:MAG: 16S rRNA (guanine(966)-N(2))-methyltransferase RsmD [Thermoflexales bacterium]|nr:16S rRNA (guanine(966)-N(2))-methyltransferase RsmD [Thermoflexales bacterium]